MNYAPYALSYDYFLRGDLAGETYPSGRQLTYGLNTGTTLPGSVNGFAPVGGGAYTATGYALVSAFWGNGVPQTTSLNFFPASNAFTLSSTLDSRLRPTALSLTAPGGAETLGFSWAPNGNLNQETIANSQNAAAPTLTQNFTYDPLNRLLSFSETGGNSEWTEYFGYDQFGNRSYLSSSVPSEPQYAGVTPQAAAPQILGQTVFGPFANNQWTQATYDSAGDMTTKSTTQVGPIATYDGEGRVQTISGLPPGTIRYYYDGNGNRVMKVICSSSPCTSATAGAQITTYVYDAVGQLAAEYGPPASVTGTQYLFTDHLGTTRLMVSSTGQVTRCYDFAPFGEELGPGIGSRSSCYEALSYPSASQASTALKFTGKERDAETGLDYFGARYLSGAQGRFTSPDPEGASASLFDPQRWNAYSYAVNNPHKYIDPDGEVPLLLISAGVGAAVGAVGGAVFDVANQLIQNGVNFGQIDGREVGAAALGGLVSGGIAGLTLGIIPAPATLTTGYLVTSAVVNGGANVVGGIVQR